VRSLGVLIAEEKDIVRARLAAQLEGLGHRVVGVARDGRTAVTNARELQPDLMVLVVHLPPNDGIEAARAILTRQAIPSILLTGYGAADLVRRAQEAGVLAYLTWPVDARSLGATIETALTRYRELGILCEQDGDLQRALCTRIVVERAKRMLMRRLRVEETAAFDYLLRYSLSTGRPMRDEAADLLTAEDLWFGKAQIVQCVNVVLRALAQRGALGPSQAA